MEWSWEYRWLFRTVQANVLLQVYSFELKLLVGSSPQPQRWSRGWCDWDWAKLSSSTPCAILRRAIYLICEVSGAVPAAILKITELSWTIVSMVKCVIFRSYLWIKVCSLFLGKVLLISMRGTLDKACRGSLYRTAFSFFCSALIMSAKVILCL